MKKLTIFCMSLMIAMSGAAEEWTLVTDASDLKAGDQIVLACASKGKVASVSIEGGSTKYLVGVDATFDGTTLVSAPENTAVFTLKGDAYGWILRNQDGQNLGATAAKKLAWDDGAQTWTISVSGNATIASTNDAYGSIQYNSQYGARFSNYTSSQTAIQIYRLATPKVAIAFEGFPYAKTRCEAPTYAVGSTYTLPTFVPEKDGKKLDVWEYAGTYYAPGAPFIVPETDVLFSPVWSGEQGVETVNGEHRVTKFIRDGQMIINRDGIMFNVLGERL